MELLMIDAIDDPNIPIYNPISKKRYEKKKLKLLNYYLIYFSEKVNLKITK